MDEQILSLQKKMSKELDKERYNHTLGVMYTSASLAMCHGANLQKAMIAGLLHDCAKGIPNSEKVKLCEKYGIHITEVERANPGLLHAKLGAYLAKKKYGIKDADILNSISSHTTGRPGMSLLEKIIYIADYMEPGRNYLPNFPLVRKLAYKNLEDCLFKILEDSLKYLHSKDKAIDPMTEKTYNYYKERKLYRFSEE